MKGKVSPEMDAELEKIAAETEEEIGRSSGRRQRSKKQKKAADILIELSAQAELFHAPDGTAMATIPVAGHLETWPVRTKGFRQWLVRDFFTATRSAPNKDAIQSALNVIEAKAHFDGPQHQVYIRIGEHEGRIYVDLADAKWRAIEICPAGWRIIDSPPIRFRRSAGMLPLPEPVRGGDIKELSQFLNVKSDGNGGGAFILTVSYLLAALRERGPYPVLCLNGEHGSAKSTFERVLRRLVDPNSTELRSLPREDRDLFITANNGWLLPFDNVSRMPDWISDTLCRLATGGGFATRQLYSDMDETLFDAMRPIVLNGIEDMVTRPDLADRSIFLNLENITDNKRKAEKDFWDDFERARPRILGALLDGVACGLRELPTTRLETLPRMADFALWATACERAFWDTNTFLEAYDQNRDDAVQTVLEADLIATNVQKLMAEFKAQGTTLWRGTAADLLGALKTAAGEEIAKKKEWPADPTRLSGRLRRAAATLRRTGIEVVFVKSTRPRVIEIKYPTSPSRENSVASVASVGDDLFPQDINELASDAEPDDSDGLASASDASASDPTLPDATRRCPDAEPDASVGDNPLKNKVPDAADATDAKIPTHSGGDAEPAASVPFMITREMKGQLRERGYSDEELSHLTPQQAHAILGNGAAIPGMSEYGIPAESWAGAANAAPRQRFKIVGKHADDVTCAQCGGRGDVFKIARDEPGAPAEALHRECARFWFVD